MTEPSRNREHREKKRESGILHWAVFNSTEGRGQGAETLYLLKKRASTTTVARAMSPIAVKAKETYTAMGRLGL